jgi:hypothetical protein
MWKDPVSATPSIVQVDFGPWGQNIPGDGEAYCGPTSLLMGLYWLSANGFTQLAPATYNGQEDPSATNLERVIAGLVGTSTIGGTSNMQPGMAIYLAACGIGPDQYMYIPSDNPDLPWLLERLVPNVASDPDSIVLATFAVGWYSRTDITSTTFTNDGGHVLAPLSAQLMSNMLTLNNSYPASFVDVPNLPSSNPQTVLIASVPSDWTLPDLTPSTVQYSQVITPALGQKNVAVLWGGNAWSISASVLPSTPGYQPATWTLAPSTTINTNGGTLTVLAPLAGNTGFIKDGEGTLLLINTNQSTGSNWVNNGTIASTQTAGSPFGTGSMTVAGGGRLLLSPDGAATVDIASGAGSNCTIGTGGGAVELVGGDACVVTIGGNSDGTTPNIQRTSTATFTIAPGAGIAQLGSSQQVLVAGSASNLPCTSNGIVAPYILGEDSDAISSGKFLTYDSSAGFEAADTVSSLKVLIKDAESDTVYEVVDDQTIADGGGVQIAALEMNCGEIYGSGGSLLIGSQASGDLAGIIMNGGSITTGTLAFGAAEGLIYASDTTLDTAINARISGSAGLTVFGPGAVTLAADNSASLTGPISINSGTLIAAGSGGSATGLGGVFVNSAGTLQVSGIVGGPITVNQSGTLYLDGGTVQGNVTIAATGESSAAPGGILQGGGTMAAPVTLDGVIRSGPDAGIITFQSQSAILSTASLYWRLQGLVDNETSKPGAGWNALRFNAADCTVGSKLTGGPSFYLDFSLLTDGDPDGGNEFWTTSRTWDFLLFDTVKSGYCWWDPMNFFYQSGSFGLKWDGWNVQLIWTPATSPQTLGQRRRARTEARDPSRQPGTQLGSH